MRSSSFANLAAMFGAVGLLLVAAPGCRIEAHSQTSFEDKTQPPKVSTKDWNGEPITIENGGVNPLTGTGGVEVKFDAAATKITAEANFAATADDDKKSDADASIRDALLTFVIEESANGFAVKCGHGNAHGTSNSAASGCKMLRVTLPAGSATKPHNLTVGNGNGSIRVGLAEGGTYPFVNNLTVDNNGLGEVNVRANPVKGAKLIITSEREAQVALPTTFSAAKVVFTVDEDDAAKIAARIITSGFTGMASGSPYPTAGATAEAAAELNVTSKGPFSDDTITIASFTP
jgi:hypothetical protein